MYIIYIEKHMFSHVKSVPAYNMDILQIKM